MARKRDDTGQPLGARRGGRKVVSSIGVLLTQNRTGCSGVMVNGREHKTEGNACQYNISEGQREKKSDRCSLSKISLDEVWRSANGSQRFS